MAQNTTIKDIARALGISKSTVSRALADRFDVKPETKKAVIEMAEKMHYRPNPFAQNLIKRRTKIIGVDQLVFCPDHHPDTAGFRT